jgi:hypothetical protein
LSPSRDLTIDAALNDPLIRIMMKADRVNPNELEALLRAAAGRFEAVPARTRPVPASLPAPRGRGIFPRLCAA